MANQYTDNERKISSTKQKGERDFNFLSFKVPAYIRRAFVF